MPLKLLWIIIKPNTSRSGSKGAGRGSEGVGRALLAAVRTSEGVRWVKDGGRRAQRIQCPIETGKGGFKASGKGDGQICI